MRGSHVWGFDKHLRLKLFVGPFDELRFCGLFDRSPPHIFFDLDDRGVQRVSDFFQFPVRLDLIKFNVHPLVEFQIRERFQ